MKIIDIVKIGFKNIMRKKLRTFLTVLSFAIGSFSIVIMISLGIGMSESYKKEILQSGNLTTISVNTYMGFEEGGQYRKSKNEITEKDIEDIKKIDGVAAVTPMIYDSLKVKVGKYDSYFGIRAIDFDYLEKADMPELAVGSDLTMDQLKKGIILGGAEDALYFYSKNGREPEEPIDIFNTKYKIFMQQYDDGKEKTEKVKINIVGQFVQTNGEYDYSSYIDINRYYEMMDDLKNFLNKDKRKQIKEKKYEQVEVLASDSAKVPEIQEAIKELGFGSQSLADMLKGFQEEARVLELILGGIGSVSLFVAAIGIANTMIMSTYERTKEIGVMKVLGCKISDIKKMFLFEAGIIGCIGGASGILLSYGVASILNNYAVELMYGYESDAELSVIPLWLTLLSLGFSFAIGVIAGYFPARRATKIRALEALKTE